MGSGMEVVAAGVESQPRLECPPLAAGARQGCSTPPRSRKERTEPKSLATSLLRWWWRAVRCRPLFWLHLKVFVFVAWELGDGDQSRSPTRSEIPTCPEWEETRGINKGKGPEHSPAGARRGRRRGLRRAAARGGRRKEWAGKGRMRAREGGGVMGFVATSMRPGGWCRSPLRMRI
jgi:hypothetical protein